MKHSWFCRFSVCPLLIFLLKMEVNILAQPRALNDQWNAALVVVGTRQYHHNVEKESSRQSNPLRPDFVCA
jgi:hypothetical protein